MPPQNFCRADLLRPRGARPTGISPPDHDRVRPGAGGGTPCQANSGGGRQRALRAHRLVRLRCSHRASGKVSRRCRDKSSARQIFAGLIYFGRVARDRPAFRRWTTPGYDPGRGDSRRPLFFALRARFFRGCPERSATPRPPPPNRSRRPRSAPWRASAGSCGDRFPNRLC